MLPIQMQTNALKRSTVPNCDSNRLLLFIKDILLNYSIVDIDQNVRVNLTLLFRTSTARSVCSALSGGASPCSSWASTRLVEIDHNVQHYSFVPYLYLTVS